MAKRERTTRKYPEFASEFPNALVGESPSDTALNISCVTQYLASAEAHIEGVSALSSDARIGRALIMECIENAAALLYENLQLIEEAEARRRG